MTRGAPDAFTSGPLTSALLSFFFSEGRRALMHVRDSEEFAIPPLLVEARS
jgi:hypothetical protein